MRLPFVKMSGAGNDFIVVDHARVSDLGGEARSLLVRNLCRRRLSVGADGLISVEPLDRDRVRMIYNNADGSRAAMCGNGGRCAARYAFDRGWVGEKLILEADDGPHPAIVGERGVKLGMIDPRVLDGNVEIRSEMGTFRGVYLDTGVPHLVLWVEDVEAVDVDTVGREFRFEPRFRPGGTNVDFSQSVAPSVLKVRTYERGVEGETLACGTGIVASAVAAHLEKGAHSPVEVHVAGGTLRVEFVGSGMSLRNVTLDGGARVVFEGVADAPLNEEKELT